MLNRKGTCVGISSEIQALSSHHQKIGVDFDLQEDLSQWRGKAEPPRLVDQNTHRGASSTARAPTWKDGSETFPGQSTDLTGASEMLYMSECRGVPHIDKVWQSFIASSGEWAHPLKNSLNPELKKAKITGREGGIHTC